MVVYYSLLFVSCPGGGLWAVKGGVRNQTIEWLNVVLAFVFGGGGGGGAVL